MTIDARGRMSLLFHGDKLSEVLEVAWRAGLLASLDDAPPSGTTLEALADALGMVPGRLYKLLDCLEALEFVQRFGADTISQTRYRSTEPLSKAAELVFADESIERDRNEQPWRALQGRLHEVLRGDEGIAPRDFAWPPSTPEQSRRFAQSMAAGIPPIAESFARAPGVFGEGARRVLDVGGGSGTLARRLAEADKRLHVDVFELEALRPLALQNFADSTAHHRLGFCAGDAIGGELPDGYDAIAFVRVLHDWPAETAQGMLTKACERAERVVICEEFRTPSRLAVQAFWSYLLIGVDSCVSRLREWSVYEQWLGALGFDSHLHPGAFDIGVGVRR